MSELIDKQAVIDALCGMRLSDDRSDDEKGAFQLALTLAVGVLRDLPSAQPMQKKGRWQEITASDCSGYDPTLAGYDDPVVGCVCSVCREGYEKELMGEVYWNYCPNCGADMRGDTNE